MPATVTTHRVATISTGERRSSFVWAILAGFAVAGIILLIALAWLTLSDTNATVNDVRNAQVNHAQTLDRIDRVDARVKTEINKLNSATATVNHILAEAGQVSGQLLASQHIICEALHVTC